MTKQPAEPNDPAFEGNSREGYGAPTPDDPTREVNWTQTRGRYGGPDRSEDIEDSYGTDWEDDVEPVWEYNSAMPTIPFDEFMSAYSPEVRRLAAEARRRILDVLPNAIETVDSNSRLVAYAFGPKMADTVFVLMPYKDSLNLGIYHGADLPDPAGLLQGSGKRHRHVKIRRYEDLEQPALGELLTAAAARQGDRSGDTHA